MGGHYEFQAFAKTTTTDGGFGRIARLTGFAEAPGLFAIVQLVPGFGPELATILASWKLLTWFTSIREAGPFSSQAACLVMILQLIALLLLMFVILFAVLIMWGATYGSIEISTP